MISVSSFEVSQTLAKEETLQKSPTEVCQNLACGHHKNTTCIILSINMNQRISKNSELSTKLPDITKKEGNFQTTCHSHEDIVTWAWVNISGWHEIIQSNTVENILNISYILYII